MRHRTRGRLLGRERASRTALFASLARAIVTSGHITTTVAKAKEVRPIVERLVTVAKRNTLTARRLLIARTRDARTADRLIKTIGPKFATRPGGYTRLIRLGTRAGDNADLARLEFIE